MWGDEVMENVGEVRYLSYRLRYDNKDDAHNYQGAREKGNTVVGHVWRREILLVI